ncbi:MAG: hypothetical protein BGO78_07785 [Chloroflexi bacterium 44-23]|nr:MAG: hypothetical protein BGO78_07785 [Chloroflexi bacterium 44-23]
MALREPFNAISHFIAAVAALAGTIWLLSRQIATMRLTLAILIYGISLVSLFLASAIYHGVNGNLRQLVILRKLDHSVIYLLIAGSYTPICIYFFNGFWQWGLLAIVWTMALTGIIVKMFVMNAPRWITAGAYLVMGWISILAIAEIKRSMPPEAIRWLIAGGLFYTIGAIVYISKKLDFFPGKFGFHEIWHLFVIMGALSHYILIAAYIV